MSFSPISNTGWVIIVIVGIVGTIAGYKLGSIFTFSKKFPFIKKRDQASNVDDLSKEEKKILNDPKLLMKKLEENGPIYSKGKDNGRVKLDFSIEKVGGKDQVVMKKTEVPRIPKPKETKDKKEVKKKAVRKPKKKVGKRGGKK